MSVAANNLILQLKADNNNLTLENNQLITVYNNLILENNQLKNNLTLERNQFKNEIDVGKRVRKVTDFYFYFMNFCIVILIIVRYTAV